MTQNMVAVSDIRTVPVGEDLTTDELRLQVLRGIEKMYRVDKPLATGVALGLGEWGVLGADGTVSRPTATPVAQTYLCFAGTDRFDVKATGQVTLIMNSPIIAKSNRFDTTQTYAVGDYLTVKDLGAGEAFLTKQASTEPKLARVQEVGDGYLVYETLLP